MGAIRIMFPIPAQPVATGIETDSYSFKQLPDILSCPQCPLCGREHSWRKHEAWMDNLERRRVMDSLERRLVRERPGKAA
jgi:hypothetical protein